MTLGGDDALDLAERHADRVGLVHLKDVRAAIAARLGSGELGLMAAVQAGLFAPLGEGDVPVADVIITLERHGYDGLYVLEQDVAITGGEPPAGEGPVRDVAKSVAYLRSVEPALSAMLPQRGSHRPVLQQPPSIRGGPIHENQTSPCADGHRSIVARPRRLYRRRRRCRHHIGAGGDGRRDTSAATAATEETTGDTEGTAGPATTGGAATTAPDDTVDVVQGQDLHFHVITHGDDGVFWSVVQTARRAGRRRPRRRGVRYFGANNDAEAQSQAIEAAIAEGSDGIAISLADPEGVSAAAQAVVDAGIPLYTLNSGLNNWKDLGAVTHVGQDEIVAGQGAGERFNELGVTKILCGRQEQTNIALEERCDGLAETFEGEVVSEFVGLDADPTEQENQISALLQAEPRDRRLHGHRPEPAAAGDRRRRDGGTGAGTSPASTSRPT